MEYFCRHLLCHVAHLAKQNEIAGSQRIKQTGIKKANLNSSGVALSFSTILNIKSAIIRCFLKAFKTF